MPTFILMKEGALVDKLVGANPQAIRKMINGFIHSVGLHKNQGVEIYQICMLFFFFLVFHKVWGENCLKKIMEVCKNCQLVRLVGMSIRLVGVSLISYFVGLITCLFHFKNYQWHSLRMYVLKKNLNPFNNISCMYILILEA